MSAPRTEDRTDASMLAITTGFLVLFLIFHHRWMLIVAVCAGLIGLLVPPLARLVHRGWMKLAHALGWFNGRVLLGAVFFLLLTPIALLRRLGRSDGLALRKPAGSIWTVRDHTYTAKDLETPW
ncbi:MAG: hypothetical protein IT228_06740 [Flavobacteriales bacterium]|nr:hypothetical protein [Flavobacteriales bacterium]MCC6577023.1 hypothetical protein [Flavobacteriales bacterium]NUQ14603.1 hypothetical protein [Flavobacteriales bacterium]